MTSVGAIMLAQPDASIPSIAGAKAANLAVAARAGLPVVPGFVISTDAVGRGLGDATVEAEVRSAWTALTAGDDTVALVVRSSSTVEDAGTSSLAGQFTSVLDVCGWSAFVEAVHTVTGSAGAVTDADGAALPMAVLVQRQVTAALGGVLFGVDPVTGARDRVVVEVVGSRPDQLVGGTVTADHYVLSPRGRVVDRTLSGSAPPLPRSVARRLARLAARTEAVFGSAQDVEWAVEAGGELRLLQSRPVTAAAPGATSRGRHRVTLGPGPVAETFPDPLRPLEADLWLVPLRQGIERALAATGSVADDAIARSPVVVAVGGWAAVDLGLIGVVSGRRSLRQRVNPAAIVRRLHTAWRVGRLRVALPALGAAVAATVDRDLASIGRLDRYTDTQLATFLAAAERELATVHTMEVLAGMLLHGRRVEPVTGAVPAPIVALDALARGRARGLSDAEVATQDPVVLTLVPPCLPRGDGLRLPTATAPAADPPGDGGGARRAEPTVDDLDLRDALRLRARWLQELTARLTGELLERLRVGDPELAPELGRELRFDELLAMAGGQHPVTEAELKARADRPSGPPLPTAFELDAGGTVHVAGHGHRSGAAGLPASAGRAVGVARHRPPAGVPPADTILVTRFLEPRLAPLLPGLAGLVAETGSALSHLAILAREAHVPTVVGVEGALTRFPPGTRLLIDGSTGEIEVMP